METPRHEVAPPGVTPEYAYEQNYALLLELMGRINARLAAKRRIEKPTGWEHIGEQEEVIAMLRGVLEFLEIEGKANHDPN